MSETPDTTQQPIAETERRQRVLYSVSGAIVRLAYAFGIKLKELSYWIETSYFHFLRDQGMTLNEIARELDISPRKASMLSRQLKSNFMASERQHGAPRRVEFLLWAEPMSAARLKQLLQREFNAGEIDDAIAELLEQERIKPTENPVTTTYTLAKSASRMYRDEFLTKIDGLNHFSKTFANVTLGRFETQDPRSFARTATLRCAPDDTDELREFYQDVIWPKLVELDERAKERDDVFALDVSISWAPYQLIQDFLATDNAKNQGE